MLTRKGWGQASPSAVTGSRLRMGDSMPHPKREGSPQAALKKQRRREVENYQYPKNLEQKNTQDKCEEDRRFQEKYNGKNKKLSRRAGNIARQR
jgi:hypothetical protein